VKNLKCLTKWFKYANNLSQDFGQMAIPNFGKFGYKIMESLCRLGNLPVFKMKNRINLKRLLMFLIGGIFVFGLSFRFTPLLFPIQKEDIGRKSFTQ